MRSLCVSIFLCGKKILRKSAKFAKKFIIERLIGVNKFITKIITK